MSRSKSKLIDIVRIIYYRILLREIEISEGIIIKIIYRRILFYSFLIYYLILL